jgi:hypothetical protein
MSDCKPAALHPVAWAAGLLDAIMRGDAMLGTGFSPGLASQHNRATVSMTTHCRAVLSSLTP